MSGTDSKLCRCRGDEAEELSDSGESASLRRRLHTYCV
jgi:hypothetical protein